MYKALPLAARKAVSLAQTTTDVAVARLDGDAAPE